MEDSATDLITISGDYVDNETSRIRTGDKVQNNSEHAEPGQEGAHITKGVHQSKPHVINTKTRQSEERREFRSGGDWEGHWFSAN